MKEIPEKKLRSWAEEVNDVIWLEDKKEKDERLKDLELQILDEVDNR